VGLGAYLSTETAAVPELVHRREPWYQAYMEALFEHDPDRMPGGIRAAEELISRRQREIFVGPSTSLERRALKEALHALAALRMLQH
jgi:hypothetical protein